MYVSAVEPHSRSRTGNITAAIAVKFSITSVHPSRFPFHTLVSLSPLEFVTAATRNFCASLSGRTCLTFVALAVHT